MIMALVLLLTNAVLINFSFLVSFFIRYGQPFPERSFEPYKSSFVFLTLIYILALSFFGVYKKRVKSSWELFKRIFLGLFLGTLLSIALVYVFRVKWGSFPTSVFAIAFVVNLFCVFAFNRRVLKAGKRIKKKVVVIGEATIQDDIVGKKAAVERRQIEDIEELIKYRDIDEIVICEKIISNKHLNLLIYLVQKLKIDVLFSPSIYQQLLPERINGENTFDFLTTSFGRKSDLDELLIRVLDVVGSLAILFLSTPINIFTVLLIKITSPGPVLYRQQRVGKDGKLFTLYKFRTMINDAEEKVGPVLASRDDPRVTKVGKIMRTTRLDELPQLFNVLRGDMSLVGPRPERPHFVKIHRALRELRLAVKPGITGLAQIRNFYDLQPEHKIKYDYLYIQKRSLLLNFYILAKTFPIIFSKKGW